MLFSNAVRFDVTKSSEKRVSKRQRKMQQSNVAENSKSYRLLLLTTLIISGCSMCYELIISAVSTYLLGNSLLQYSITIGLFMSALGLGSYCSRFLNKKLFQTLVVIEFLIGIIGGASAISLFFANLYIRSYSLVMYVEIIAIGVLAGAEIPLLTRIVERDERNLKRTLSSIFSFDYIGGLIGAVAFPLLLMPKLGFFATSFLCGLLNIIAAAIIVWKYEAQIEKASFFKTLAVILAMLMLVGMVCADNISHFVEQGLYRDDVIFSEQTLYQKIVITKHKDDTRLYIDGNCQFSTLDEYRYHEALVHIPMMQTEKKDNVLILGGGDGMTTREVLKYDVKHIDLVDLDAEMIKICSENKNITAVNNDSLTNDKVSIFIEDAYQYLEHCEKKYDVIIVDLPDPNNEVLNKLYSNVFYRLCGKCLAEDGVLVTQSTSPYYATEAFWCINKTIESEGFYVKPYHLEVPAFGDWGFNMAMRKPFRKNDVIEVDTRYLTSDVIQQMFVFAKDEKTDEVAINQLTKPVLMQYYNRAIETWQ